MKSIKTTRLKVSLELTYDVVSDEEAARLAKAHPEEAFRAGATDRYVTVIPDMFEGHPELLEYLKRTERSHRMGNSF